MGWRDDDSNCEHGHRWPSPVAVAICNDLLCRARRLTCLGGWHEFHFEQGALFAGRPAENHQKGPGFEFKVHVGIINISTYTICSNIEPIPTVIDRC